MAQGATRKIRKRRSFKAVKRVGRMLLGTGVVLMMLSLVGGAAWRLLELPVERIAVTGELKHVSHERLMSRVNTSLQGGFLWVDLQAIRQSLEQLPWVYRVVVKRHWPNSLEIQVFEQLPIARWGDDAYLNHAGEIFRPARLSSQLELPGLAGPAGSDRGHPRLGGGALVPEPVSRCVCRIFGRGESGGLRLRNAVRPCRVG